MAEVDDYILSCVKGCLAQAEQSPYLVANQSPLVFEGGDVVVVTGEDRSEIFLVHSSVLKTAEYFIPMLSDTWGQAKTRYVIDGVERDVWILEMYFDVETNLPLLKHKTSSINTIRRVQPQHLTGVGLRRWEAASTDDDYREILNQPNLTTELPPRLQFLWSEPQPRTYDQMTYHARKDNEDTPDFPPQSLEYYTTILTYAKFLHAYEEEMPHLDNEVRRLDPRFALPKLSYTHDETLEMARNVLNMLLRLLYGKRLKLPAAHNGAEAGWLCAHLVVLSKYYQAFDLIRPDLENALLSQPKGRIWRAIYANPRFYLMLGFHLSSVAIYIEAVKHVVGPSIRQPWQENVHQDICPRAPDQHVWELPNDFQEELFPDEVVQFLLACRYQMNKEAAKVQEALAKFLNIYSDTTWERVPEELLEHVYSALTNKLGPKFSDQIVRKLGAESEQCWTCKLSLRRARRTTYSEMCTRHQHRATKHDVNYPTYLPPWEPTTQYRRFPAWNWPPPPYECSMVEYGKTIAETKTKPATLAEILALGLGELFITRLSTEDYDISVRREEQKRLWRNKCAKWGWRYE